MEEESLWTLNVHGQKLHEWVIYSSVHLLRNSSSISEMLRKLLKTKRDGGGTASSRLFLSET